MDTAEKTLLGTLDLKEAKRIKFALESRGVAIELASNPESCGTGGCAPTVELYARVTDMPEIQAFMREESERLLRAVADTHAQLPIDPSLAAEIFDPERETARCPACGETFSTQLTECPGCGLGFGGGPI